MILDIIVAVLGIISAIVGLLTAIIQLKNATHQRRHQESQDGRSYIDIGKWLKRALVLFGIPFAVLLVYREWDLTKEVGRDATALLNREVSIDTRLSNFEEKTLPVPIPKNGYYWVRIFSEPEYSYVCPGAGGVTPAYVTGGDGFGNIQIQGSKNGSPVGNGGLLLIDEGKITIHFQFPSIQWEAIQKCKAIIIGGLRVKFYLKEKK